MRIPGRSLFLAVLPALVLAGPEPPGPQAARPDGVWQITYTCPDGDFPGWVAVRPADAEERRRVVVVEGAGVPAAYAVLGEYRARGLTIGLVGEAVLTEGRLVVGLGEARFGVIRKDLVLEASAGGAGMLAGAYLGSFLTPLDAKPEERSKRVRHVDQDVWVLRDRDPARYRDLARTDRDPALPAVLKEALEAERLAWSETRARDLARQFVLRTWKDFPKERSEALAAAFEGGEKASGRTKAAARLLLEARRRMDYRALQKAAVEYVAAQEETARAAAQAAVASGSGDEGALRSLREGEKVFRQLRNDVEIVDFLTARGQAIGPIRRALKEGKDLMTVLRGLRGDDNPGDALVTAVRKIPWAANPAVHGVPGAMLKRWLNWIFRGAGQVNEGLDRVEDVLQNGYEGASDAPEGCEERLEAWSRGPWDSGTAQVVEMLVEDVPVLRGIYDRFIKRHLPGGRE